MPANPVVHIVDDDEAVRQSLAFMLGSAGLPVRLYESASAFLEDLDPMLCGCLVTDVRMPDMTGIELLGRLKDKVPCLPAIVITGHGDVPLAVEAMKAGAVDFIEKPFEDEVLLRAVEAALKRAGGDGDTPLQEVISRLATLSERERQVLELRFGLLDGKDHTLEEVGQYFNVTRERIRQIEAKALRKLRHPTRSRHLRDYLES